MLEFSTFAVIGLVAGSMYALIALGLVFVYRSAGVINFGVAGFATLAGFSFASVYDDGGRSYWLALAVAVGIGVLAGAASERLVIRELLGQGTTSASVGTLAVVAVTLAAITVFWAPNPRRIPPSFSAKGVNLGDLVVTYHQIGALALTAVLCIVVWALLDRTRHGRALRCMAESRQIAMLMGIPIRRYDAALWATAGGLAALAGVVIAPQTGMNAGAYTVVLVKALAAAMVGRLVNPWLAVAGGLVLGFLEAMVTWQLPQYVGLRDVLMFLTIAAALLLTERQRTVA